jgi:hypothetical protein
MKEIALSGPVPAGEEIDWSRMGERDRGARQTDPLAGGGEKVAPGR